MVLAMPTLVSADTVWLRSGQATNALERPSVKVEKIENGVLHFRSTQSDRVTERPLEEVVRIAAEGEPALTQAEEAFAAQRWDQAVAAYQKAAATSTKQWVKDRSGLRLVAAAEKSGKFPAAVAGWATLMARDPGLAAKYKPQVPANARPGSLDPAVAEVERVLNDAKLPDEQRQTLLAYQLELARANGDTKKAQAIGSRLSAGAARGAGGGGGTAAATGPENAPNTRAAPAGPPPAPAANAALALQLANLALDGKKYDEAVRTIDSAAAAITEPAQQVEALYVVAEARAGLAGNDPAGWKDAALAYMRVVARARAARVASPRLPDALLKTAAIQERLNATQEALLLYQQVADEFKGTEAATRAAQAAERLGKPVPSAAAGS
jgi:TolA-binding protein